MSGPIDPVSSFIDVPLQHFLHVGIEQLLVAFRERRCVGFPDVGDERPVVIHVHRGLKKFLQVLADKFNADVR